MTTYRQAVAKRTREGDRPAPIPAMPARSVEVRRFATDHDMRACRWQGSDIVEDNVSGKLFRMVALTGLETRSVRNSLPVESAIPENPKAIESESPTQLSAACIEPADNFDAAEVETPHEDDGFVDESLPFMGKTLGEEGKL